MTAVLTSPTPRAHTPSTLKVTQARVIRSEWTKFRSLKSTVWTLLVAVVLTVGIGALFSAVSANQYSTFSPADRLTFDPTSVSLGGILFSQLAVGVLGALLMTGEYSTGMIRSSLTAVPRRLPVLWGKIVVFTGVVLVVSLVTSFGSFFLGQALLHGQHLDVSIGADGVLRSVVGSALYVTVAGLIGLAIGGLLRNTAAAISTFVGAFFVIPPLTMLLPSSWTSHFVQYLPSNAGEALWTRARIDNPLSPWTGFAVLCLYAVVLTAAAAWRLQRTDA